MTTKDDKSTQIPIVGLTTKRKRLNSISPSQIKTWRDCPRKWAWQKIHGVSSPGTASTDLGTRVHEIAEAWLLQGTEPDLEEVFEYEDNKGRTVVRYPGRIFQAGQHLNPCSSTYSLEIEGQMLFKTDSGPWAGRIDVHYRDGDLPVVQDHKTTSSMHWALTEDPDSDRFIGKDPQALLYGAWACMHYSSSSVRLDWIYYQTVPAKGKHKAKKVSVTLSSKDMEEALNALEQQSQLMWDVHSSDLTAKDLTPKVSSCSKYGGCPYMDMCSLTQTEKLRGAMAEEQGMVDAQIRELLEDRTVQPKYSSPFHPPAPPPPPPPPVPVEPPPPPAPPIPQKINPPEAPEPGGEGPIEKEKQQEEVLLHPEGPSAMSRKDLKAFCMYKGWVKSGCRLNENNLRMLVEDRLSLEKSQNKKQQTEEEENISVVPRSLSTLVQLRENLISSLDVVSKLIAEQEKHLGS